VGHFPVSVRRFSESQEVQNLGIGQFGCPFGQGADKLERLGDAGANEDALAWADAFDGFLRRADKGLVFLLPAIVVSDDLSHIVQVLTRTRQVRFAQS
jgi:hypothetical protein